MYTPFYWVYSWGPNTIRRTSPLVLKSYSWLIIFYLIGKIGKITFFFSVYIPNQKNDIIFYLIGKNTCFFLVGYSNLGSPVNKSCFAIYYIWIKRHIAFYWLYSCEIPIPSGKQGPVVSKVPTFLFGQRSSNLLSLEYLLFDRKINKVLSPPHIDSQWR